MRKEQAMLWVDTFNFQNPTKEMLPRARLGAPSGREAITSSALPREQKPSEVDRAPREC